MDLANGFLFPDQIDPEVPASWLPSTPAKQPSMPGMIPIALDYNPVVSQPASSNVHENTTLHGSQIRHVDTLFTGRSWKNGSSHPMGIATLEERLHYFSNYQAVMASEEPTPSRNLKPKWLATGNKTDVWTQVPLGKNSTRSYSPFMSSGFVGANQLQSPCPNQTLLNGKSPFYHSTFPRGNQSSQVSQVADQMIYANGASNVSRPNYNVSYTPQGVKMTYGNETKSVPVDPLTPDKFNRSQDVNYIENTLLENICLLGGENRSFMSNTYSNVREPIDMHSNQSILHPPIYGEFSFLLENEQRNAQGNLANPNIPVSACLAPVTPYKHNPMQDGQYGDQLMHLIDDDQLHTYHQYVTDANHTEKENAQIYPNQNKSGKEDIKSLQQAENQEELNGENHVIDLNKTPQQKPRRKKHRPKVIVEGKPSKKQRQPKKEGVTEGDNKSGKRKYLRKNGRIKDTPSINIAKTGEADDRTVKKPVKRALHFDSEVPVIKNIQPSTSGSECDKEFQGKNKDKLSQNDVLDRNKLSVSCELEQVENSSRVLFDLNNPINKLTGEFIQPDVSLQRTDLLREDRNCLAWERNGLEITNTSSGLGLFQSVINSTSLSNGSLCYSMADGVIGSRKWDYNVSSSSVGHLCDNVVARNVSTIGRDYSMRSPCAYHHGDGNHDNHLTVADKKLRLDDGKFKLLSYGSHTFPEGREALNLPCKQALTQSQTLVSLGKLQHAEQIQAYAGIQRKRKKLTESYPCNQLELTETNPCCQISAFTEGIVEGNPAVVTSTRLINKHQIHGVSCTLLNPELKCQQECEVSGFSSAHKSLNLVVFQHETLKGRSSQKFQNKQIKSRRRSSCQDMQSSSSFKHISPDVDPIDAIVEKLNFLMISEVPGYNSIQDSRQENAIVPYVADGTIILAEGSPGYSRRRSARAKVNLDSETNRVWLLLMGKDGNNNAEASDKDREKWWEEERRVFRGRVDSFIARMHLVQGDRRFSRWKGSVVDSVVGVFLTQNVSDHLSSSAFMSLAARFPFRSMEENRESRDAKASIPTEKINMPVTENDHKIQLPGFVPIHHCLNQISNVSSERQDTRRKDIEEGESLGEVTEENVFGYLRSRDIDAASTVNSMVNPLLLAKSMDSPQIYDIKSLEHGVSSQSSAMSSHNSSDSQAQIVGVRSNSKSNSYIEGITDENKWNCFDASIPFMDLLQMAGTDAFQDLYPCKSTVSIDLDFESVVPETSMAKCECIDKPHDACPSKQSRESQEGCGFEIETSHPSITPYSNLGIKMVADDLKNTEQLLSSMQSQIANTTCTKSSSTTCLLVNNSTEVTTHDKLFTCHAPYLVESHRDANSHVAQLSCMRETFSEEHLHHAYVPTELAISSRDTNNRHNPALSDREMAKCKQHESETCFLDNTLAVNEVITKTSKGAPSQLLTESTNGEIILDSKSSYTKDKHEDHNSSIGSLSSPSVLKREKDAVKQMKKKTMREQKVDFDWDSLRREACKYDQEKERNSGNMDSVDWEAVRCADVKQISDAIRERGMNNMLAERIKAFLDRLVREHGSIDLEWLRDIPPDKAKDYLLNIRGLGLKSVECVRLLTLHHLAFPVDTNVGRICVRLGWVPLQPLPEQLQLHLLELYPMLETIQKYLWPRLCKLDQRMLYELHYQMITFGKVFCTKSKPNCNSCPMRGECKHFASAFASARLALPGLEEKCLVTSRIPNSNETRHNTAAYPISLLQLEANSAFKPSTKNVEPIIEEPATPEPESLEYLESAIENAFYEDSDEIPTIRLNIEQFTQNLHEIMQEKHMDVHEDEMSKSLVALTPESASLPQPKLKSISRLRTEHQVYELPDSHRLLERLNHRETDDPSPYLLAIWTPGETAQSTEPPDISCTSQDKGELCERKTCFSCNSVREAHDQKVRGTLLIPCRTAMRGSFPLNGTYFQVNEVFADHGSSLNPIDVPRKWIWNLPRRTVYFGTSVPAIFRGLTTEGIQHCFWRGFVCVRGFDQKTRAPRPLLARLHFPASKNIKNKKMQRKEDE